MAKKTIYPGTQGRKNKVLIRPIDLTGIEKYQLWANVRWANVRLAIWFCLTSISSMRKIYHPKIRKFSRKNLGKILPDTLPDNLSDSFEECISEVCSAENSVKDKNYEFSQVSIII